MGPSRIDQWIRASVPAEENLEEYTKATPCYERSEFWPQWFPSIRYSDGFDDERKAKVIMLTN